MVTIRVREDLYIQKNDLDYQELKTGRETGEPMMTSLFLLPS